MKEEEIKKRTQEKMTEIKALCEKLQMNFSAKQVLTKDGFIENIVFFADNENYPKVVVEPEIAPKEE